MSIRVARPFLHVASSYSAPSSLLNGSQRGSTPPLAGLFRRQLIVLDLAAVDGFSSLRHSPSRRQPQRAQHPERPRHRRCGPRVPRRRTDATLADRRPRLRDHAQPTGASRNPSPSGSDVASSTARCVLVGFPSFFMEGALGSRQLRRRECRRRVDSDIYGTLRGRDGHGFPMRGIDRQKIEAELLAIDGYYQTAEEIDVSRPAGGRHHENYTAELHVGYSRRPRCWLVMLRHREASQTDHDGGAEAPRLPRAGRASWWSIPCRLAQPRPRTWCSISSMVASGRRP